jgi:rhomboid protease GluP
VTAISRFKAAFAESPVTVSIVTVTVAVWLVHEALITWTSINTDNTFADPGTAIHGQPWRLVTPLVVHFGLLHVALNMATLVIIGRPVEKVVGPYAFVGAYLLSGMGGQIASDVWYGQTVLSGGASGAIFGIVGVMIGDFVGTRWAGRAGRVSTQRWQFNPDAVKAFAIQAAVWLVLFSVLTGYIDNAAHSGGVTVGLVSGVGLAWANSKPR